MPWAVYSGRLAHWASSTGAMPVVEKDWIAEPLLVIQDLFGEPIYAECTTVQH